MNRVLVFILGMIFGVIFFFAAIAGVAFYAYSALTLETFQLNIEGLGELNRTTIKDIVAQCITWANSADGATVADIEAMWGMDFATLLNEFNPNLYPNVKDTNIFYLFQENGAAKFFDTVLLGLPLALLPAGVVSTGALSQMGEITLGDIINGEDIVGQIKTAFAKVKVGAFLGTDYIETAVYVEGSTTEVDYYTYALSPTAEPSPLMEGLANCSVGALLAVVDENGNIFQEIKDGGLATLGSVKLADVLSFVEQASLFGNKVIADLIGTDAEGQANIDFMGLLDGMTIGSIMGEVVYDCSNTAHTDADHHVNDKYVAVATGGNYIYNAESDTYTEVATGGTHVFEPACEHKWYKEYVGENDPANEELDSMIALLADADIGELIEGNISGLLDGIYVGKLLDYDLDYSSCSNAAHVKESDHHLDDIYAQSATGEYVKIDGSYVTYDSANAAHIGQTRYNVLEAACQHKWLQKNGSEAEPLMSAFAGVSFDSLLSGNFDIEGVLGDLYVGDILEYDYVCQYTYEGHTHHDADAYVIADATHPATHRYNSATQTYVADTLTGTHYLESACECKWVDKNGADPEALMGAFAGVSFESLLGGDFNIDSVLGDLYVGDILEYDVVYDCSNTAHTDATHHTEDIYVLANASHPATHRYNEATQTYVEDTLTGTHYLEPACPHNWVDKNGADVQALMGAFAGVSFDSLLGGEFDIEGVIGDLYVGDILEYKYVCQYSDDAHTHHDTDIYVLANASHPATHRYNSATRTYVADTTTGTHYVESACEYKWVQKDGTDASALMGAFAKVSFNDLLGDGFDIEGVIGDLYVGDILDYEVVYNCTEHTRESAHHVDDVYLLADATHPATHRYDETTDTYVADTVTGTHYMEEGCRHEWYQTNNGVRGDKAEALMAAFADVSFNSLLGSGFEMSTVMGDLYVGEIMNYELTYSCDVEHDHHIESIYEEDDGGNYVKVDGKYEEYDATNANHLGQQKYRLVEAGCTRTWYKVSGSTRTAITKDMDLLIADIPLGQLLDGSFEVSGQIQDTKIGGAMGLELHYHDADRDGHVHHDTDVYLPADASHPATHRYDNSTKTYVEDAVNGTHYLELACPHDWYEEGKYNPASPETGKASAIIGAIAPLTIGEISNADTLNSRLDILTIGDLLELDNTATGVLKAISTKTVADLKSGDAIDTVSLGDILNLTADYGSCLNAEEGHEHHSNDAYLPADATHPATHRYDEVTETYVADAVSGTHYLELACPHVWKDSSDAPATGIKKALADKTIKDLEGNALDDIVLGDVLGLENVGDVWYENYSTRDEATGIKKALANKTIGDLQGNALDDIQLGTILGYSICNDNGTDDYCNEDCNGEAGTCQGDVLGEHKYLWKKDGADAKGIYKAMASLTVGDLSAGTKLDDAIDDIVLGELLNISESETGILGSLRDKKVSELKDGTALDTVVLGTVLGLTADYGDCLNVETGHKHHPTDSYLLAGNGHSATHRYDEATGTYVADSITGTHYFELACPHVWKDSGDNTATGIKKALADKTIKDLEGDALNDVILGDVLGLENVGGVWYENYSTNDEATGIKKALADKTIGDLQGNALDDVQLGTILGYSIYNDNGTDDYCNENCNGLVGTCKGTPLGEHKYLWKKDSDGTEAKGIQKALAGLRVGDLSTGNKLDDAIGDIVLGELLDINDSSSGILKALQYKTVNDLEGNALNEIYLGEIFDYERLDAQPGYCNSDCNGAAGTCQGTPLGEHKFYWDNGGVQASGVNGKLADLTVGGISSGNGLTDKINTLTLVEVLGESTVEGNVMLGLLADVEIANLGEEMNKLYVGEIMDLTLIYDNSVTPRNVDTGEHNWYTVVTDVSLYDENLGGGVMGYDNGSSVTYIKQFKVSEDASGNKYFDDVGGTNIWLEVEYKGTEYVKQQQNSITLTMADTKIDEIGNISDRLTDAVTKAKVQELMDMGVLDFAVDTCNSLDVLLGTTPKHWKQRTLPGFINSLIYRMSNPYALSIPDTEQYQ